MILRFLRDESGAAALPWLYLGLVVLIGSALAVPGLTDEVQRLGHGTGLQFRLHALWPW